MKARSTAQVELADVATGSGVRSLGLRHVIALGFVALIEELRDARREILAHLATSATPFEETE